MNSKLITGLLAVSLLISFSAPFIVKAVQIENPLKYNTLQDFIGALIDVLWKLALFISPIMIIIAGFYFVTAAGDPQKIDIAKKIVLYTLIGFAVITLSKAIIEEIIRVVMG